MSVRTPRNVFSKMYSTAKLDQEFQIEEGSLRQHLLQRILTAKSVNYRDYLEINDTQKFYLYRKKIQ